MADATETKLDLTASSEPKLAVKETELATNPKEGDAAKEEAPAVCSHSLRNHNQVHKLIIMKLMRSDFD